MYEFSMPLPSNVNIINEVVKINKLYSLSKIKTFFFALPTSATDRCTFEQIRSYNEKITKFEDIEPVIKYSLDYGFKFIYLLNSVSGFSGETEIFNKQETALKILLEKLAKANCFNVRVTNFEVIDFITKNYPEFNIYLSTSTEYTQIQQFQSAVRMFPNIKEFIPSYEVNKNFNLLKNLRKAFPKIDIELIADEGCIPGCPLRIQHPMKKTVIKTNPEEADEIYRNIASLYGYCYEYSTKKFNEYLCKSKVIFPWDLEYYKEIGITKFKFVGRRVPFENAQVQLYKYYMQGIEDPKSIENMNIISFILRYRYSKTFRNEYPYRIKDIRKLLPQTKYFVKNGQDCQYKCGVECNYCNECAEKITKFYNK